MTVAYLLVLLAINYVVGLRVKRLWFAIPAAFLITLIVWLLIGLTTVFLVGHGYAGGEFFKEYAVIVLSLLTVIIQLLMHKRPYI